ncbi:hypothetical protein [Nocardia pseudovaccinii]|uniref:hypothetical protein n=1 Tax=Nocardia pseudovaccinii TaxID=189540 RepID=UPI000ACE5EE2|nr:hypothetical protein [Nocardia pseudovaccinii]
MLTNELTADDFGIARNGIHLYEVDDGDQWYAYGHQEPGPIAEAINQNNRAQGYSTDNITAGDVAEVLEHVYLRHVDLDAGVWTFERCQQSDRGAVAVTVVTL